MSPCKTYLTAGNPLEPIMLQRMLETDSVNSLKNYRIGQSASKPLNVIRTHGEGSTTIERHESEPSRVGEIPETVGSFFFKPTLCIIIHKTCLKEANMRRKEVPEYNIWKGMRARCSSPCNAKTGNYQSNGISVCERWNDFRLFLDDMGNRPSEKHSIDRIDNSKGYSPENCRWATQSEQCKNRGSFNKIFTYDGKTMVLKDWARYFGIKYTTLFQRIYRKGLSFEEAISFSHDNNLYFDFRGKKLSLVELCKKYNIKHRVVYDRLRRGWDLERALTEKIKVVKNDKI